MSASGLYEVITKFRITCRGLKNIKAWAWGMFSAVQISTWTHKVREDLMVWNGHMAEGVLFMILFHIDYCSNMNIIIRVLM